MDHLFPTSDHVLLCCFGPQLSGERTDRQLRHALCEAGFSAPLARHLIRVSPLLRRTSRGRHRLREFNG